MSIKMPLRCVVRDGVLTITVNADTVKFATENHPELWDGDAYTVKVANKLKWLKSVVSRINDEDEEGSTLLTKMMDDAIMSAVEQGEEGLEDVP